MKNKVIVSIIVFIIILGGYSNVFSNLWCILTENDYFIPQESNIFIFNPTKMNSGSGGWWLYGEDNKYYYALYSLEYGYLKLQKGNEPSDFDKFNYETWRIKIPFTDTRDGKIYNTIKIGKRVWMAENLNYEVGGSRCYNDSTAYCDKYGKLYDLETAIKACPNGWHLPFLEEWEALTKTIGERTACKNLKSTSGWDRSYGESGNGDDKYDFSALPGGYRSSNGYFGKVGDFGGWWSATKSSSRKLPSNIKIMIKKYMVIRIEEYRDGAISDYPYEKDYLFSVRCLQDPTPPTGTPK